MTDIFKVAKNQLMLLQNGAEFFPQLCADIDAAQHSVYLETYIFAADDIGRLVADALQRAAGRGVIVRVLLDGYGSAELPDQWVDELSAAKVEVQWYRRDISPFTFSRSRMRRLRRLHRKLAVIDNRVAFVGGIKIGRDISKDENSSACRFDYAVRVQGAVAQQIQGAMLHLWGIVSWVNFRRRSKENGGFVLGRSKPVVNSAVTFLLRDNVGHRRDIESAYLKAIDAAQHEIIIANAYFLPGRTFRLALKKAVQRDVRVVLLLQGKVEYRLQHYATHALYDHLLAAKIEIYEYQASYLHAKVAVVDGEWATVGSSNIDPFSLLLAREANLVIRDAQFAGELRTSLRSAIDQDAVRIEESANVSRGWIDRLGARISYGLVRWLIGMLGYGRSI
jgi:cardiolipin synthase